MAGFVVSQADYLIGDAVRKERERIAAGFDALSDDGWLELSTDTADAIIHDLPLPMPPLPQEQQR